MYICQITVQVTDFRYLRLFFPSASVWWLSIFKDIRFIYVIYDQSLKEPAIANGVVERADSVSNSFKWNITSAIFRRVFFQTIHCFYHDNLRNTIKHTRGFWMLSVGWRSIFLYESRRPESLCVAKLEPLGHLAFMYNFQYSRCQLLSNHHATKLCGVTKVLPWTFWCVAWQYVSSTITGQWIWWLHGHH